jgi:thymidylate synthase ThyX
LTKKITSAIRRIAPNGQSNEIGFTVNFRALRHFVMLRSTRHAEFEIRAVSNQVYNLIEPWFPKLFWRAKTRMVEGWKEIYGMRMQPYEVDSTDPEFVKLVPTEILKAELATRT